MQLINPAVDRVLSVNSLKSSNSPGTYPFILKRIFIYEFSFSCQFNLNARGFVRYSMGKLCETARCRYQHVKGASFDSYYALEWDWDKDPSYCNNRPGSFNKTFFFLRLVFSSRVSLHRLHSSSFSDHHLIIIITIITILFGGKT